MAEERGLVDLHCHHLPGVDDGAASLQDGIDLVRAAIANGIDHIVLTPHVHPGRYANTAASLSVRFESFRRAIGALGLPVRLALSAEVRFSDELFAQIERDEIPLLISAEGEQVLLLELPHSHVPPGWEQLLRWVRKRDITPMIAHPERNKDLMKHPERVAAFIAEGCLLQVTAASLIGGFGPRAQDAAEYILKKGWATILATDSHNLAHRPPLLREGAAAAAVIVGESKAWDMVSTVPARLSAQLFANAEVRHRPSVNNE